MQICNPSCVTGIPQVDWSRQCDIIARKGGINRLLFFVCDPNWVFPEAGGWGNIANWAAAICDGLLYYTGEVMAQKPKGSFTKKRFSSCAPEQIIAGSKTVTFLDYNAAVDLVDYTAWQAYFDNQKYMSFGFTTCDDRVYQVPGDFSLEVDEVIEDTNEGNSYFDGVVTFQTMDLVIPIEVPGLNDFLKKFDFNAYCYQP